MNKERDRKVSFVLNSELEITIAVTKGHKPHDKDEYQETRNKIKSIRKDLFGEDMLKNKLYKSVNQIF